MEVMVVVALVVMVVAVTEKVTKNYGIEFQGPRWAWAGEVCQTLRGGPLLGPPPASLSWTWALLGLPLVEFYRFFVIPKRRRKINDFSNRRKTAQMVLSIDPWTPRIGFWTKNHDICGPFWHRFLTFFRNWRKCKINEEYNAKRGSEPLKNLNSGIDFSLNFHVFSKPSSRGDFSRDPAPI